jgi:hypothetical protein
MCMSIALISCDNSAHTTFYGISIERNLTQQRMRIVYLTRYWSN